METITKNKRHCEIKNSGMFRIALYSLNMIRKTGKHIHIYSVMLSNIENIFCLMARFKRFSSPFSFNRMETYIFVGLFQFFFFISNLIHLNFAHKTFVKCLFALRLHSFFFFIKTKKISYYCFVSGHHFENN